MALDHPARILYDKDGNPVAVALDNSVYRLQTSSSIVGQASGIGSDLKVTVITDPTVGTHKRLQVEADIKPGASINFVPSAGAPTDIVVARLSYAGSFNMIVDGSVTPVVFSFSADPTNDIVISELRFVLSAGILDFSGSAFGKGGGSLTNGVLVDAVVNDGVPTNLALFQVNEDFLRLSGRLLTELGGANDVMVAGLAFGGRTILKGGSSDVVRVTIRDSLLGGARDLKYFQATFYGVEE